MLLNAQVIFLLVAVGAGEDARDDTDDLLAQHRWPVAVVRIVLSQEPVAGTGVIPPYIPVDRAVHRMRAAGPDDDDVAMPRRPARGDDDHVVVEDGGLHAVPNDRRHVHVAARDLPLHAQRNLNWSLRTCWCWWDVRSANAHRPIRIAFERAEVFAITHGHSFRRGVRARSMVRAAQDGMSTGSLKTLVRTLIEPTSRNGFWRVFSVGFVPEDERHRAEHPQVRALGDDAKLVVQERARTVLLPIAAHEDALAQRGDDELA